MAKRYALIDLGGTLVDFFGTYHHTQLEPAALRSIGRALSRRGREVPDQAIAENLWNGLRRDPADLRVKPLEDRLAAIFGIRPDEEEVMDLACRSFMEPLFAIARVYEDSRPFLEGLRDQGIGTVLVSNITWGCPAYIWREELRDLSLMDLLDRTVVCRDVGWRKPDSRIFRHALSLVNAAPADCVFVGDDPEWDVEGPSRVGIRAVLVDRRLQWVGQSYQRATGLREVLEHDLFC